MDNNDRQAIDGLFNKIVDVERTAGPIDPQADALIRERVAAHPAAPYLMAQTIVVQEQALNAAQERIEQLEQQPQRASGGLFSGLFGGGAAAQQRPQPMSRAQAMSPAPQQMQPDGRSDGPWGQQRQGGGFLQGAAQTAMGVAGGVLLGNAIAGMFGGSEATAAEPAAAEPEQEQDFGMDDSMDDMG